MFWHTGEQSKWCPVKLVKYWANSMNGETETEGPGSCTSQNSPVFRNRVDLLPEYARRSLVGGGGKKVLQVREHALAPFKSHSPDARAGALARGLQIPAGSGPRRRLGGRSFASLEEPQVLSSPSVWSVGAVRTARELAYLVEQCVNRSRRPPS